MSKTILADLISETHGLTKAEAEDIVETMFIGIKNALVSQGSFSLMGFGRWTVTERAARVGRNPASGERVQIPAQKVVRFAPGAGLKKAINPDK
jgi:DNA-binding protein HU-beta